VPSPDQPPLPTDLAELRQEHRRAQWRLDWQRHCKRNGLKYYSPESLARALADRDAASAAVAALTRKPPDTRPVPPHVQAYDVPADWWIAHFGAVPPVNPASGWVPPEQRVDLDAAA